MPCAAPCSRLPCDQRCTRKLSCGHQCPGLCGETCPEDFCQICSVHQEAQVDLLEMKTYREIDLSDTPIVVLGCGHFFTTETLDGHMGIEEVYLQDKRGQFTGLRNISAELARSIPRCPNCQCPIRQHCTKRFNRVVNRAVIDEMSKRFLVNGKNELRKLERQILELEQDLERSRANLNLSIAQLTATNISRFTETLQERNAKSRTLEKAIRLFGN